MILDELIVVLDFCSEYEIYSSFVELVKGKIVILVIYRLVFVCLVDRILVLKVGKLVEMGIYEEFLQ